MVGITHYVTLSDWFLSLSNMHLRFFPVFSWLDSLFLVSAGYYFVIWLFHSLLIHSLTEGNIGCFQILAILDKAAINNCVQGFVWT